jgi:hypothetical protein
MARLQTGWLAVGVVLAMTGAANAATWSLGNVESYVCRDKGGNSRSIQYCHNCKDAVGNDPYVSWTFVVRCDATDTKRRARGELKCGKSTPSEPAQKTLITNSARAGLPGAGTACPR